jgi:hypothetical protein
MSCNQAEILVQRASPEQVAVSGKSMESTAYPKDKHVAGGWVGDRRGPTHAVRRNIAQEYSETIFPQQLPRIRTQTEEALLQVLPFAGRVLQIQMVAENHRGAATTIRGFPQKILAGGRPPGRKTFFR